MKKTLTLSMISLGALLLAGCSFFPTSDSSKQEEVIKVPVTGNSVDAAKQECLSKNFQWDDQTATCEREQPKEMCLAAGNQWNDKNEQCEYAKENCLAAGLQWNDQDTTCEYTKDNCLAMNAQWDEQTNKCEIMPHTLQQQINDCLDKGDQRDHTKNTCETMSSGAAQ